MRPDQSTPKALGGAHPQGRRRAADRLAWGRSRALRRILTLGVWAILFAPLIFVPQTLYPGMVAKTIFFRVAVEVLLVPYLALAFLERPFRPRLTPLLWSVLAYLGALLMATLTSADPYLSWWGNMTWMEGVFGFLHYVLFFVILAGVLRTKRDWLNFFKVSSIVSFLVAALSVRLGLAFPGPHPRIGSTLGHYAYAAAYLLFQTFFAAMVLHWETKRSWRVWSAAVITLDLAALALTADRGAMLGLWAGVTALAAGVLILVKDRIRLRQASAIVLAFLLLAPVAFRLARGTRLVKLAYFLSRLSEASLDDQTVRSRLISARISWHAFQARPLLGYGPELYSLAYYRNFNPEQLAYEPWVFERAHNKLFDVLVMEGLAGFIPFLAIFVGAAWMLRRALKNRRGEATTVVLTAAMLVAYLVQNLFLFDTPMSYVMIFAVLAFVQFTAEEDPPRPEPVPRAGATERGKALQTGQRAVLAAVAVLTIASVYDFNAKAFAEAWVGRRMYKATDDPERFLAQFDQALSYHSWPTREVVRTAAQVLATTYAARQPQFAKAARAVASQTEGLIERPEFDPRTYIALGTLYDQMAYTDPSFLAQGESTLKAGIRLAPEWPDGYYELAKNYLHAGRRDEAIAVSKRALALNPRCAVSRWRHAFLLLGARHQQEGLAELEVALSVYDYHNPADLTRLVYAYHHVHDLPRAIQYQNELVGLEPEDAQRHAALARLYLDSGDKAGASREMQAVARLDPRYSAAAHAFLRDLETNDTLW